MTDRRWPAIGATWLLCACLALPVPVLAQAQAQARAQATGGPVQIDDMTWTELRDRINTGSRTVLVPIGGTEQNGPHIVLGKHNARVKALAGQIARVLGNAVVAPVLAYVPEGAINPPAAHMRFTGTVSIPEAAFEALLDATARSFCQHGFAEVVFLGDHGGYQPSLVRVAARLNGDWAAAKGPACRAHALTEYYQASSTGHAGLLRARGFAQAEIGSHAGLADTALALAIDPALVRQDKLAQANQAGLRDGVAGDPRRASADLGQIGVDHIVRASAAAVRQRIGPGLGPR